MKGIIRFVVMMTVLFCSHVTVFSQTEESVDLSQPRIWTATTGHKLAAVYAGREGNNIRLKLQDGEVRTITFDKLSDADQRLLDKQMPEKNEDGNTASSKNGEGGRNHPFVEFLTEAKHKRLSPEEGVAYYQHVIDALYKQVEEYNFKYPEDFIKEDNSFNTKYLKKIVEKKKPVSQRKNLLTGENMPTPVYVNEPLWKSVTQELSYVLDERYVHFEQSDILYSGNEEKSVKFGVSVDRKARNNAKYSAWYREDSRNYLYIVQTFVEKTDDETLLMGGVRESGRYNEWLRWCYHDIRKGIFYTLHILIGQDGKISILNSDEGSFQFYASAPNKKAFLYPRSEGSYYSVMDGRRFALGRYDLNGASIPLEKLWAGAGKRPIYASESAKPTSKHDDPLNVFAERNIKDK